LPSSQCDVTSYEENLINLFKDEVSRSIFAHLYENLTILDAGCGTGLCGPVLRPFASHLIGIDISSGILEKARSRHCYDQLEKSELTVFLQAAHEVFDVVAACDTFNYFGFF
jgi:predicted TPR repeat methyltransferase